MSNRENILAALRASRQTVPFAVPELGITHLRPLSGAEMTAVVTQKDHPITLAMVALTIANEDGSRPFGLADVAEFGDAAYSQRLQSEVLRINRATKEAQEELGKPLSATAS